MIKRILVPTDFSPVATNAVKYALQLASKTGSSLDLLHVNGIPVLDTTFPPDIYQNFVVEMDNATKENFANLERELLQNSGIPYKVHTTVGFVKDEVMDFAEKNNCGLILMGTTGAGGIEEMLVGSNAASIVGASTIPVMVIPPTASFTEIRHIVYSSDFNEPEFPAVATLLYFAGLFNADLSVIHVRTEYDQYFDSANHFFKRNKDNIPYDKWKLVKLDTDDVMEGIEGYINQFHTDLLVMAKHNRSFFDRLFHRSLSKKMAYHTRIPLLVLTKE
jgi:nucleotide-binding universal stress UspA family protein